MTKQVPWLRICLEGVVIVASILLAFGIDAWWQGQQERTEERENLVALLDDFVATGDRLDLIGSRHRGRRAAIEKLLVASEDPASTHTDSLSAWLTQLYQGHTVEAVQGTLDALRGSGQLSLIQNDSLRAMLSAWASETEDLREIEMVVVGVIFDDLYPATREHLPLPDLSFFARPDATQRDERAFEFMSGRAFENLLAQFIFLEGMVLEDMQRVVSRLDDIVRILRAELDST